MTPNQIADLSAPSPSVVYFIELQFTTSTQRLSTWNRNLTWGGQNWIGLGGLISIGQITESESLASNSMTFTLNAADIAWLSLAVGDDAVYRHRLALLYMCPFNPATNNLRDTPQLCWRGRMDALGISIADNGESVISMKCETAAFAFKRRPTFRINAEQQKRVYPTDTGFDYLADLIAKPKLWLSKKFQAG